jgi:hypothetical protein
VTWTVVSPNRRYAKVGVQRWPLVLAYLRLGWTLEEPTMTRTELQAEIERLLQENDSLQEHLAVETNRRRAAENEIEPLRKRLVQNTLTKLAEGTVTPEERVNQMPLHWRPPPEQGVLDIHRQYAEIVKIIREAVSAEREACAKIAEDAKRGWNFDDIAYAIRSRSKE